MVEYLGEAREHRDAQAAFRPWQNDLFVGLRHSFDDPDDTRLELGGVGDLTYGDSLLVAAARRHVGADLVVSVDAVWILAGRSGPLSLLHELEDRSSVGVKLVWTH